MSSLRSQVSEELLPYVERPGQYIGGEVNQLRTDWEAAQVRMAIAFPDAYTVGVSHLGCQILYWLANHMDGVACERVYCPWVDAEQVMRKKAIPLFTWESRAPVRSADILGISLQYEMAFTNVLTILDLAGIPLRSEQRTEHDPLVIAGGPQADNPEPMAPFFDLIVIGDGEESTQAIIETVKQLKREGASRDEKIVEIARRFPWAYAPNLYDDSYNKDGTLADIRPRLEGLPETIERCQTPEFEDAPFPERPLIPNTEAVHERISIEIMRGCPQRCRFCHAGFTKRPLRWRSVDRILEIAEEAWRATGYEEIGLLSLSSADYPRLGELTKAINERFASRNVSISIPSLRVDMQLANIPWQISGVRRGGMTIAVEAARDQMREAIKKKVSDDNLINGVMAAYRAGWKSLKLYYMVGFPGETEEDIRSIYHLSRQISLARKEVAGGPAKIKAAVSWLVPKPFTPFQWAAQPRAEYYENARRILLEYRQRGAPVQIKMHGIEQSILEGVFARGDRRLADVVEHAWRMGARFDGWTECFKPNIWREAFERCGIDPDWYAHRERPYTERLPWGHIVVSRGHEYLQTQYDDVFTVIGSAPPEPAVLAT
jgi:radical SAM family uncharacterized protein